MGACCAKSRADSIDLHAELGTAARPRDADVTRNPFGAVAEQANHVSAAETPGGRRGFVPFAQKGSDVTLSQGGAVATKSCYGGINAVAAADESLTAGVHCWEVEITKTWVGFIMVGVCKADVRPEDGTDRLFNQRGQAWVMRAFGGALYPGYTHSDTGKVLQGSRLGCKLDLGAGTLHFYKDGVKHGPGWTGVVGPVKRCVEMRDEGNVATLVRTAPAFRD